MRVPTPRCEFTAIVPPRASQASATAPIPMPRPDSSVTVSFELKPGRQISFTGSSSALAATPSSPAFVRSRSHKLEDVPGVYVLLTSTDIRIFFKIEGDTITILDIAKQQSIMASGHIAEVS